MAKLILWCLLLMSVAHLCQTTADSEEEEGANGPTLEELSNIVDLDEDDVVVGSTTDVNEDGEEVQETSVTDRSCHIQITIATSLSSNSTVIDDLDDDTELTRISSAPKICYVLRHANVTGKCRNGYIVNQNTTAQNTSTTTDISDFEVGQNLTLSDLPINLQPLCRNLTIQELIQVETNNSAENDVSTTPTTTADVAPGASGGVRRKRSFYYGCCRWGYRCYVRRVVTCAHCCYRSFWWSRNCGRFCCTTRYIYYIGYGCTRYPSWFGSCYYYG